MENLPAFLTLCTVDGCSYKISVTRYIPLGDLWKIIKRNSYVVYNLNGKDEIILSKLFEVNTVKKIKHRYLRSRKELKLSEEELRQYRQFTLDTTIFM
jgi:hypothetical protein